MTGERSASPGAGSPQASHRTFFGAAALLFAASAAVTIVACASMSKMGEMPMSGGWTMSMAWMRMPGQTWPGAAAAFLAMWVVMMLAMMLPSFAPLLWRYRQAVTRTGERHGALQTAVVAAGYFFVWTLSGMAAFVLGVALATIEMRWPAISRAVPAAGGVVVLLAGGLQLSAFKVHHLACCRSGLDDCGALRTNPATAWRYGLRLGLHCTCCCAGLTVLLLVMGIMDLRAMGLITVAITAERLASGGVCVARASGIVVVGTGLALIVRAAGLG